MSEWTNVSINLKTTETTSKADIANVYHRYASHFEGSEGGLHVSFVEKTKEKPNKRKWSFENYTILTNVLMEGVLRNVGESEYDRIISAFEGFYDVLVHNYLAEGAIVVFDCQSAEEYVQIYCRSSLVRVEKIKK